MTRSEVRTIAQVAKRKQDLCASAPARYITRCAVAGCYIFVGTLISNLSAAWFYTDQPGTAKLLGSFTFATALILIVLLGSELFTGSNLVMGVGLYEGTVSPGQAARLWITCWFGNLLGILLLALLFAGSGASRELMSSYLALTVPGKLNAAWYEFILKGALCNLCVCLGVLAGLKMKSESGKIIVIFLVIAAFILSGFEHSIANMAVFALYTLLVDTAHLAGMCANLFWVTIGNLLGGAVLLGLPIWFMAEPDPS